MPFDHWSSAFEHASRMAVITRCKWYVIHYPNGWYSTSNFAEWYNRGKVAA